MVVRKRDGRENQPRSNEFDSDRNFVRDERTERARSHKRNRLRTRFVHISHKSYQIIFFHRAIYISSSPTMEEEGGGYNALTPIPRLSPCTRVYQCIHTLSEPHENNSADAPLQPPRPSLFRDGQVERVGIGPW